MMLGRKWAAGLYVPNQELSRPSYPKLQVVLFVHGQKMSCELQTVLWL